MYIRVSITAFALNSVRPKIKICVFQVTRPSLNFYPVQTLLLKPFHGFPRDFPSCSFCFPILLKYKKNLKIKQIIPTVPYLIFHVTLNTHISILGLSVLSTPLIKYTARDLYKETKSDWKLHWYTNTQLKKLCRVSYTGK